MSDIEPTACKRSRIGELNWILCREVALPRIRTILENPERVLQTTGEIIKCSGAVTVWRDGGIVLKRWKPLTIGSLLKDLVRPSHARRAFTKACRLEAAGISTARPIGAADRRRGGVLKSSYFVMEAIPGAVDLASRKRRGKEATREIGCLLGQLHDSGFTHRDLKPTNILFDPDGRAYLIDLEGLRTMQRVPDALAVGDLAKLGRRMIELATLSPADAASFLRDYCRARGRKNRRWWWREIRYRMAQHLTGCGRS